MANEIGKNNGEIIIYQSEDGKIRLDVRLEEKTVWLTIDQMAELYGKARSTINEHILNAYKEKEIEEAKTMRKSEIPIFLPNRRIITTSRWLSLGVYQDD